MQKEVDGDVARSRKNVKDARKSAIRRVKMATDTILQPIESMAEEAVAQAMHKRKVVHSFRNSVPSSRVSMPSAARKDGECLRWCKHQKPRMRASMNVNHAL